MDCVSSTAEETLDTLSANQEGVTNAPSDLTVILSAATVQHSADDESEEYESANEGDTDGEAAASEEAVAASKALNVCISSSPTKMTDTSPTIDACAFTTPPGPSNQTTSPDKIENPVDYLQTQLSQACFFESYSFYLSNNKLLFLWYKFNIIEICKCDLCNNIIVVKF